MALPNREGAIYSLLTDDGTIQGITTEVWNLQAPEGTALPYIIFYQGSGVIPNMVPRDQLNDVWRIESRADSRSGARQLHDAVYDAVHENTITLTGWTAYWFVCESEVQFIENVEGTQVYRMIWDVRLKASKD